MAVKIRLMRMGKKKQPTYRVVVADGRSPRDGRFIEVIGRYDPRQEPSIVEIDNDKALDWLHKGAQPTDPVRKLLEISGAWSRYKVAKGQIHTVASKPVPPKEAAETPQVAAEPEKTEPVPEPAPEAVSGAEDAAVKTEESPA
jgi:small subunit ribosomal protein S16